VFQDSVSASFGGLINRRLQVSASTGMAFGTVGLSPDDDDNDGYTSTFASTGLSIGLTRNLGVNVGYTYYRYRFDNVSALPPGALRQVNRHAVQAGLQVSAPIFERQRARSANASR
jgi:opacity protein-like surface antigen